MLVMNGLGEQLTMPYLKGKFTRLVWHSDGAESTYLICFQKHYTGGDILVRSNEVLYFSVYRMMFSCEAISSLMRELWD